jgi:hypothetical protein
MRIDDDRRPRRYSEGMEHMPALPQSARVGSWADGMARAVDDRVGTYADGMLLRPDAPALRRVGSYADELVLAGAGAPARPRLGVARGRPGAQPA